jgi:hypothetical protein
MEEREAAENVALRAELVEDSPAGFYMMLGVLVASLLLAVIWVSGTRQELPASVIQRARPAAAPAATGPQSRFAPRYDPAGAPPADPTMPATSLPQTPPAPAPLQRKVPADRP